MKRFGVVFAVLLAASLVFPAVALATDEPFELTPPREGVLVVPADTPLVIPAGWVAGSRGLAMAGPRLTEFYFTLIRHTADGDVEYLKMTTGESGDFWLPGVSEPDPDMYDFEIIHFNEHIGAHPFAREWEYPIEDGLPAGEYTFESGCVQTRTAVDLLWYFEGQHSALRLTPGDFPFPDWDFVVE